MENSNSAARTDWNDLSYEILVRIFMSFNVADLAVASLDPKSETTSSTEDRLLSKSCNQDGNGVMGRPYNYLLGPWSLLIFCNWQIQLKHH
ncbi:hypothetical protein E2542_SST08425 [Spatholobus suberectus]|nr:hypothetical protein E2542_SST08425 [Spatholobus suberectus]